MKVPKIIQEFKKETKYQNISMVLKKALDNYKRANSSLWVNSLSFYTIMSLVPIFAILFSLGSWLGVNDNFLRQLIEYSPLDEASVNLLVRFANNFLENTRTGILAGLGFLILGWTLISMFTIIEKSFNDIWKVKKSRILIRKFTDYFAFIIFFPTLLLISSGTTRVVQYFGYTNLILKFIPFVTLMIFFTCLYMMIPNTRVKFLPALISSIFISLFFYGFQNLFIFLQDFVSTYNKIYGSFSVVFIFLFWLKIMWFFLILGAHLSYFLQNKTQLIDMDSKTLSFYTKEKIGVLLIKDLVRRYKNNETPATIDDLEATYKIPKEAIRYILDIFIDASVVGEIINPKNPEIKSYVIIKNIDTVDFKLVFYVLEHYGKELKFDSRIEFVI